MQAQYRVPRNLEQDTSPERPGSWEHEAIASSQTLTYTNTHVAPKAKLLMDTGFVLPEQDEADWRGMI